MNTEKDGSYDRHFLAILELKVGGKYEEKLAVRISAESDEEAFKKSHAICQKITRRYPEDCVDPKDYPYHPVWTVFFLLDEGHSGIPDLTLEDDIDKLDGRWLEDKFHVRKQNDYWTEWFQPEEQSA